MKSVVRYSDAKYTSNNYNQTTLPPSEDSKSVIKYIAPRVITSNLSNDFQGSLRGIAWSRVGSDLPTPTSTERGLATLVQRSTFSTIPAIHSIDGERIIDEQRELSRITETLCEAILKCCNLETHNRAQELQIEWLKQHMHQNCSTIEKLFQTEIESARKLKEESHQQQPAIETKLTETHRTTSAYDEQYEQLLSRRNAFCKELFHFERQIAQNNAEAQFLQRRIHNLDDESKFYLLKNQALDARNVRLRYKLDEEVFSLQALKAEVEILASEKITNEDVHITSFDDIRNSTDFSQVAGVQFSSYYSNQLNHEVQRIRDEYEKKITVYREELHRKFELELHRYQMQKSLPTQSITKEHELKLEQYYRSQKDVIQQVTVVRASMSEIIIQIETLEKTLYAEKRNENSSNNQKQQLITLNQLIKDREQQLDKTLRIRKTLKQQIENYRERLNRHGKDPIPIPLNNRLTIHDTNSSFVSPSPSIQRTNVRSSLPELTYRSKEPERPLINSRLPPTIIRSTSPVQRSKHYNFRQSNDFPEKVTSTKYANFNVDQDCEELHRLLNDSTIDEITVIRIFCNRNIDQRLQIRDHYKRRFNKNLSDDFERITNASLSKFLRLLLLSPVECDCFELRRILKRSSIDENILIEIFFSRSNKHIQTLREMYKQLFKNTLEQDILAHGESDSSRVFIAVLQSDRPETNIINDDEVLRDARDLFETEAKWRVDGSTFVRLLCTRSIHQLKQIFAAYQQFSSTDIEQTIKAHTVHNLHNCLTGIIEIIRNRARFFAYGIKNSLKGAATSEEDLNRIISTRCEIDMVQIKTEYEIITYRTLYDHIQTDLQGNYKRAVLELLRQPMIRTNRNVTFQYPQKEADRVRSYASDQSTVQWRQPAITRSSDTYMKRTFVRSYSDQSINESRPMHEKRSTFTGSRDDFSRNYQMKSSSSNDSSIIYATPSRRTPPHVRRTFRSLSPTVENHLERHDDSA